MKKTYKKRKLNIQKNDEINCNLDNLNNFNSLNDKQFKRGRIKKQILKKNDNEIKDLKNIKLIPIDYNNYSPKNKTLSKNKENKKNSRVKIESISNSLSVS